MFLGGNKMSNEQKDYHKINMQAMLFIAGELHKRGYEKLHVTPYERMSWQCIYDISGEKKQGELYKRRDENIRFISASKWMINNFDFEFKEVKQSIQELTDLFEEEHNTFLALCRGDNQEYVDWYSRMLSQLQEGELPYAYADYFSSEETGYWKTTLGNKITTHNPKEE